MEGACRACGLYLAPMATMTAQRPRGGLSSASASSAPASSSSSSRPLPAAPEALPLLSHDLHNGVEEQLLGELEQEIMGPGDNAGTYYLPSPPRSAPRWAGDAGSSAAAAQGLRVEERDDEEDEGACETSALLVTTAAEEGPSRQSRAVVRREEALVAREGAAAARDFSALHSPPHEGSSSSTVPSVYPTLRIREEDEEEAGRRMLPQPHQQHGVPAPPTYREFSSNPAAFPSPSATHTPLGRSGSSLGESRSLDSPSSGRQQQSSSSSMPLGRSLSGSTTAQHQAGVLVRQPSSSSSQLGPPMPLQLPGLAAAPSHGRSGVVGHHHQQAVVSARVEDLKYVQCIACGQWLQVVCHAQLVYCPSCTGISSAMPSNTRWPVAPLRRRRDEDGPVGQMLACFQWMLR